MRVEITTNYVYIYDGFEISFDVNNVDKVREWIRDDKIKDIINMLKYALERVEVGDEEDKFFLEILGDGGLWYGTNCLRPFDGGKLRICNEIYENLKKVYEALKAQQ